MRSILRHVGGFSRDPSGLSAVEFALILPVMVALLLGMPEFTEAYAVWRKLEVTTSSVADLVARAGVADAATQSNRMDMEGMEEIATSILSPFSAEPLRLTVTSVQIDDDGRAQVVSSCSVKNGTPHPSDGGPVALPPSFTTASVADPDPQAVLQPGMGLVMAEASFDYLPRIGYAVTAVIPIRSAYYFRPRGSVEKITMTCAS